MLFNILCFHLIQKVAQEAFRCVSMIDSCRSSKPA